MEKLKLPKYSDRLQKCINTSSKRTNEAKERLEFFKNNGKFDIGNVVYHKIYGNCLIMGAHITRTQIPKISYDILYLRPFGSGVTTEYTNRVPQEDFIPATPETKLLYE